MSMTVSMQMPRFPNGPCLYSLQYYTVYIKINFLTSTSLNIDLVIFYIFVTVSFNKEKACKVKELTIISNLDILFGAGWSYFSNIYLQNKKNTKRKQREMRVSFMKSLKSVVVTSFIVCFIISYKKYETFM